MKSFIVAVDFDGTIVDHRFPDIGEEVPGAIHWLKVFQGAGAKLILWTMRSDGRPDGTTPLADAVEFCRSRGIEFWGVNANPEQASWTSSPKVYAHTYVDDAGHGCPLRENMRMGGRPFVDWDYVGPRVLAEILKVTPPIMNRSERDVGLAGLALIAACLCVRTVGAFVAGHAAWAWRNRPWFRHRRHRKPTPKGPTR